MTESNTETQDYVDYTLFIDESGRFGERDLERERDQERPSSQICGIVIPGDLTGDLRGKRMPTPLLRLFPLNQEDHAVDLTYAERAATIERVVRLCERRGWRLTRIINNSGVGEGDIRTTYTRMVGELIACLYDTIKDEDPERTPRFHLVYAQVLLGKRVSGRDYYFYRNEVTPQIRYQGEPIMIERTAYQEAVSRELIIDLQHGLGLSERDARAAFGNIQSASARIHPALRLSDLVSNCSYKRGRALRDFGAIRAHLLDAIEPYDYELHPLKSAHLAEELATHRALGQAIIVTIEHLTYRQLSSSARDQLRETLNELIEDLSREHSAERATDLEAIADAVEDWVLRRRDHSVAERLIERVTNEVLDPLERHLTHNQQSTVDLELTRFKLLSLSLANANYNGRLTLSRDRREALTALRASVAHHWEAAPVIMIGQLRIAKSHLQTLELDRALEVSEEVCGFYRDLSEMVSAFEGGSLLAARPKIEPYGSALNATLMVERYLCLSQRASDLLADEQIDEHVKRGYELAELALSLLSHREDRARVMQQVAHLEQIMGHLNTAWRALYVSLGGEELDSAQTSKLLEHLSHQDERVEGHPSIDEMTPEALRSACLQRLERIPKRELKYPLFHTLRLTLKSLIVEGRSTPNQSERALIAFTRGAIPETLRGLEDDHPAPAILGMWSSLLAQLGDEAGAVGGLRALCELVDEQRGCDALELFTLGVITKTALGLYASGHEALALELVALSDSTKGSIQRGDQDKRTRDKRRGKRDKQGRRAERLSPRLKRLREALCKLPELSAWLEELERLVSIWPDQPRDRSVQSALHKHIDRYPH